MKILTLTAGLLLAVLSGAAHAGDTYPGGVAAPIFWSELNAKSSVDIPEGQALTIFSVYRPTDTEGVIWSIAEGDSSRHVLTDRRLVDLRRHRYLNFSPVDNCGGAVLRTYERLGGDAGAMGIGNTLLIGKHTGHPQLPIDHASDGLVELIVYDRALQARERQRVESYLAIRHGLTLDQEDARHYLSPTGRPIWDGSRNRAYRHRIFGLQLDADQVEAGMESVDCGGDVLSVSAGGAMTPYYLLISDDDRPTVLRGERLERTWVMEAHGTVPSRLRLHLRPRQIFTTLPPDNDWDLLIDTSGTARFERPIRISRRGDGYDLPAHRGRRHFTFAPARPLVPPATTEGIDHLSLSPNPSTDGRFQLRLVLQESADVEVDIFSSLGRRLCTLSSPRGRHHELSGQLPVAGTYHLRLRAGETVTTTQLTVQ
jgi:hypothetical protein